eukprot:jgi/Mesvir1/23689/Mv25768-RA.1
MRMRVRGIFQFFLIFTLCGFLHAKAHAGLPLRGGRYLISFVRWMCAVMHTCLFPTTPIPAAGPQGGAICSSGPRSSGGVGPRR